MGRKYALTTVRSRATRFHWPLYGDEIEERVDAARPTPVVSAREQQMAGLANNQSD